MAKRGRGKGTRLGTTSKSTYLTIKSDIPMLQSILTADPYANDEIGWNSVVDAMKELGFKTNVRNIKERMKKLMRAFEAADMAGINTTGTEEEQTERSDLLGQVKQLKEASEVFRNITDEQTPEGNQFTQQEQQAANTERNEAGRHLDDSEVIDDSCANTSSSGPSSVPEKNTIRRKRPHDMGDEIAMQKMKYSFELDKQRNENNLAIQLEETRLRSRRIEEDFKYKVKMHEDECKLKEKQLELEAKRLQIDEKRLELDQNRDLLMKTLIEKFSK